MTNFLVGAVLGFLICVWSVETTPTVAVMSLWQRLEHVQEASSASSRAYGTVGFGNFREEDDGKSDELKDDQR
ncbi:MAG: hypothetical protein Q7T44_00850 [Parvibaculum sp.]|nr:hypothetical protein [Parvibaculum sp.]